MFRITQGTPTEFQVVVFCGIVFFVMLAPVMILTASLIGYLTRPTPASAAAKGAELGLPIGDFAPQHDPTAEAHLLRYGHYEIATNKTGEIATAVSAGAA